MNKFIYDEQKVLQFLDLFPDLQEDEVIFMALFQRNKHISAEDRKELGLSRCNVVDRVICTSKDKVLKELRRWEGNPLGYLTSNGQAIPNEALVPYITVQPISVLKAYQEYSKVMTEYLIELGSHRGPKANKENTYHRIKKSHSLLLDCHQHAYSRKVFIDVDYDGPKDFWVVSDIESEFINKGIKFIKVETQGGIHFLLDKTTIKFNYNELIAQYADVMKSVEGEIIVSNNMAIPIPGCYQYGSFEVRIIE